MCQIAASGQPVPPSKLIVSAVAALLRVVNVTCPRTYALLRIDRQDPGGECLANAWSRKAGSIDTRCKGPYNLRISSCEI